MINRLKRTMFCMLLMGPLLALTGPASATQPQARLYIHRVPTPQEIAQLDTHALYEPPVGCYLGAFIDFDSHLHRLFKDQNATEHQDPTAFEEIVGKTHCMYFFYLGYGKPLPTDWVRSLAARHKFVHIALEPNDGLSKVKDDAYLQKLADDMRRSGAKIFLRFASEMNGDWSVYYRDPVQFRRKYRLVHQVMKRRAPNVATVWCPYTPYQVHLPRPHWNVEDYYPGDDATDWVGVNMYNVTFHNDSRDAPAENEHPCDLLNHVYTRYAARKPMMICEFAATHYARCEGRPRPDFAVRKIATLYSALPRLYPRVKCINYFDGNTIAYAGDRASNDYSVTSDREITATYRYMTSASYFLSTDRSAAPPPLMSLPMRDGEQLRGKVMLSCWVRGPSETLTVRYKVDGHLIYTARSPDHWECFWDAGSVPAGRHTLTLEAVRSGGKRVASQQLNVMTSL